MSIEAMWPNEVLRVTSEGEFIWSENADELIEKGDFSASPALPHVLRVLRRLQPIEQAQPVVNYCRECLTYNGHQEGCSHYTSPPKRKPLTDEEIDNAIWHLGFGQLSPREVARAIEAAHGIKESL